MNKLLNFLSGLLIGGGVAALVTLFVAPKSGRETRQAITQTSIDLKERVQEVTTQARKSSTDVATDIEHELSSGEATMDEVVVAVEESHGTNKS